MEIALGSGLSAGDTKKNLPRDLKLLTRTSRARREPRVTRSPRPPGPVESVRSAGRSARWPVGSRHGGAGLATCGTGPTREPGMSPGPGAPRGGAPVASPGPRAAGSGSPPSAAPDRLCASRPDWLGWSVRSCRGFSRDSRGPFGSVPGAPHSRGRRLRPGPHLAQQTCPIIDDDDDDDVVVQVSAITE